MAPGKLQIQQIQPAALLLFAWIPGILFGKGKAEIGVKVIHAEGRIFYNEIYVNWVTEFESEPFDFVIEKSREGEEWIIAGKVRSKGDHRHHGEYEFVECRNDEYKFYRIRKEERLGLVTLSEVELVDYSIEVDLMQVSVNHDRRLVMVYTVDKDQELLVRIYDRIGKQVLTRQMPFTWAGDFIYHLNIEELQSGRYLLVITQTLLDKSVAEKSFTLE